MKRISTGNSIIQSICWIGILLLSIFLLSTTAYAGLRDGLIAHYPFNGNPNDVGPNGYHGTENGGVSLTDDRMNNLNSAYNFDGYDGYIKTGKFQLPSVFSVSMWINAKDTLDGQMFLGKLNAALGTPVMLGFADGGYGVWVGYEFYADGDKTTGWQHLAVVVEKTGTPQNRVRFYKNGKLLWSRNQFAPIEDTSAGAMAIGAALPNGIAISYFIGEIDDVRIYDRTLSQTEIELLFDPTQGLDITSDNDIDGEDLNYFAESLGQIRWYRDQDKDSYSDGTSIWGPNRPDDDYYREDELKSISGDCDDSDPAINPGATGTLCPPFGSCCYTVDENCVPVYHCDDNVSERVCINELYGTFNKDTLCSNLTPDECPMGNDLGACCQTMVSGGITTAVCNDNLTETKCDDNSGSFFSNVECSDLTPEECPLPEPTGSCCHPKISYVNEDGVFPVQCLDNLTEYKCKLLQGTWDETQACADLDETECPPFGACCYDDGGTTKCANWMLESNCNKLAGSSFSANEKCSEFDECDVPLPDLGACCLTTVSTDPANTPVRCVDARTIEQCNTMGGTWFDDQACDDLTYEQCPALTSTTGACCQTTMSGDGTTTTAVCNDNVTDTDCAANGGSFFSDRPCSDLTSEECPVPEPTGSCCHPKISYVNEDGVFPVQCLDNLTEYKCKLLQGTWDETQACADLDETECPPFGACCYDDGGTAKCANWMLESNCDKLSGTFSENVKCSEVGCVDTPAVGACCLGENTSSPEKCLDAETLAQCQELGGFWYEEQACADLSYKQCPPDEESGACCTTVSSGEFSYSTCENNVPVSACKEAGGEYFLEKNCVDLNDEECPDKPIGACCYLLENETFNCETMTIEECSSLKESTFNEGLSCGNLPDDSPCYGQGVCCFENECVDSTLITLEECREKEGEWIAGSNDCSNCNLK